MSEVFLVSDTWTGTFAGAAAGILVMSGVSNPPSDPALDANKAQLENQLRRRFAGCTRAMLREVPVLQAYDAYYGRFKKTYHVQLQLESVVLKGKPIPRVAALVEAMFMAELKNLLLTAGHDFDVVQPPVRLGVSAGSERYTLQNGQEQVLTAGDMLMVDREGVISSVLHGPDQRTWITPETQNVFFAVYAPAGIGEQAVRQHLQDIRDNIMLFSPSAKVAGLDVVQAKL